MIALACGSGTASKFEIKNRHISDNSNCPLIEFQPSMFEDIPTDGD